MSISRGLKPDLSRVISGAGTRVVCELMLSLDPWLLSKSLLLLFLLNLNVPGCLIVVSLLVQMFSAEDCGPLLNVRTIKRQGPNNSDSYQWRSMVRPKIIPRANKGMLMCSQGAKFPVQTKHRLYFLTASFCSMGESCFHIEESQNRKVLSFVVISLKNKD